MTLPRRTVLLSGLALAATPSIAGSLLRSRARAPMFEWKKLRDGVIATGGMSTGGNVLAARKGDAVLFVDAKFAGLAPTLRAEGEENLGANAAMLINTHHHNDHTSGNVAFDGLTHLAHRNARQRIRDQHERYLRDVHGAAERVKQAGGDERALERAQALAASSADFEARSWLPTKSIDAAMSRHDLDGLQIMLHHVGNGHTDNDLIVHLPDLNVIHAGDLLFHRVHPFIDKSAQATTLGWIDSCKHIAELCDDDTVVVPGHGEITDRASVLRQIEYFHRARQAAKMAIDAGTPRDEFANTPFKFAGDYGFEQLGPRTLGTIYDEVAAGER